jgi:hypothetical protein
LAWREKKRSVGRNDGVVGQKYYSKKCTIAVVERKKTDRETPISDQSGFSSSSIEHNNHPSSDTFGRGVNIDRF